MNLRWVIALFALSFSGCAVQQSGPGRGQIVVDQAELLGQRLETIRLVDGSEATLRQLGRVISFKHQRSSTVIPLRDADRAKVLRIEFIGDRTLIVVEKSSGGCRQNADVFLVRGREVSVWNFNDCQLQLEIERVGDEVFFDKIVNNQLTRTIFRDDKLLRLKTVPLNPVSQYDKGNSNGASRLPPPPRTARLRTGPPPIVADGAPRYIPGLPLTAEQFQTAAGNRPFIPEPPPASPPTPSQAERPPIERPTQSVASSDSVRRAPPPRPRGLPGEVVEDVVPVRITLEEPRR